MSIDSGRKEFPQPDSLSAAINRYLETAEKGNTPNNSRLLNDIETNLPPSGRHLAKFGFENGQDGYDTRIFVFPTTAARPIDEPQTRFTLLTAFGPKEVIIDNRENVLLMQRAIKENFVILGPNKKASKPSVAHYQKTGDEEGERQSLNDRGAVDNQGILNRQGTELQIGLLRFTGDEINHNPTKQALNDAVMYDVTRYNL